MIIVKFKIIVHVLEKKSRKSYLKTSILFQTKKIIGQICDPNPCVNMGICCPSRDGTYSCKCPLGYEGVRCEFSKSL